MFFDSGKIINEPEDKNDGKPPFILSYKLSISLSLSLAYLTQCEYLQKSLN